MPELDELQPKSVEVGELVRCHAFPVLVKGRDPPEHPACPASVRWSRVDERTHIADRPEQPATRVRSSAALKTRRSRTGAAAPALLPRESERPEAEAAAPAVDTVLVVSRVWNVSHNVCADSPASDVTVAGQSLLVSVSSSPFTGPSSVAFALPLCPFPWPCAFASAA